MKRGEIWEAYLPPPANRRPVLILSRDAMPIGRPEITVAYLTTRRRHTNAEVSLTAATDGVVRDCVVNLDSINTIPKSQLRRYVCSLTQQRMEQVIDSIVFALDMD